MMRTLLIPFAAFAILASCKHSKPSVSKNETSILEDAPVLETIPAPVSLGESVIRINSTRQSWDPGQPWEKSPPQNLRSLGAIVAPGRVLTTGEMVADATYLELETTDGSKTAQAEILAVDYEANLALLTVKSETDRNAFFEGTRPLALAEPPTIGDTLQIYQAEDNGTSLLTTGNFQSVDMVSSFLPNQVFLTYMVKASMQGAASSFSLPVMKDGALAGILLSYDSGDQISDVLSVDVISRFLENATDKTYSGFPSLGISVSRTEDPSFRKFLKLSPEQGGLYISKVRTGGAADLAGIMKGDVLLSANGFPIDRRGYYQHPHYGSVFWGNLVRGESATGDKISLGLLRDGQKMEIDAVLIREGPEDHLVPSYRFDLAPNFLVKGGLIFQELSRPVLEAFGKEWVSRAPLNLLDAYENPEEYEDKAERIIFLSGSIPTPATVGYESLRNLIVKKVNGVEIENMKTLIEAFTKPSADNIHSIQFVDEDFTVYLDENVSTMVDHELLKRGFNSLSRPE